MRIDLRRPGLPHIPRYVDALDRHLRDRAPARRRTGAPQVLTRAARLGRSMARPAMHTAAALLAAVVVASAVSVPRPAGSPGSVPTVVEQPAIDPVAAPVETSPQPSGRHIPLLPSDAASMQARPDIQAVDGALTDTPHTSARAVPTPEGGGSATAALRPTVPAVR
jgi:hypothetical protein